MCEKEVLAGGEEAKGGEVGEVGEVGVAVSAVMVS